VSPEKSTRPSRSTTAKKNTRKVIRRKPYGEKHIIGFLFGVALLSTVFLAILLSGLVILKIPDIRTVAHYKPLQTSYILDRNGDIFERIYKENRTVLPLSEMPELLPKAFVAAEDGRFFQHPGLDFFSVLRAAVVNIKRGGKAHGGSTITQQVARSLLLTREKTYLRKFKEAILAWRIDSLLSKEDILFIYLNQIYLGGGAYGVEAAAQVYFNKHVNQLTLAEIAILAGLPQAPSRYSPLDHPERALKRQRYVLNRMAADGYITKNKARLAFEDELELNETVNNDCTECGYYTSIVKNRARKILGNSLQQAGVRIHTYLDLKMQSAAVDAVRSGVKASFGRQVRQGKTKRKVPQGALVSIDACSSKVRALVGGADFIASSFDRAAIARRPAGSAFKPIVFSAALSTGWTTGSKILDAPLSIAGGQGKKWSPKNYSGKYHGETTLANALAYSYNTAAVRLLQKVGLSRVHELSRSAGITSEMPEDLSLALGSVDVSLLELTASYTPFICEGRYNPPLFIDRIEKVDGANVMKNSTQRKAVMAKQVAKQMEEMLELVISKGTGKRAQGLTGSSGGKTGTSDDIRDTWFIGFNGSNMTGVWVGHDLNESLGSGENGGRTTAPIWLDYMKRTSKLRHQ
jgi:penicillin-binding protein 1A